MHSVARPRQHLSHRAEACIASLDGWLIAVMAWICEALEHLPRSLRRHILVRGVQRRVVRDLRRAVSDLRAALVLTALARFDYSRARVRLPRWACYAPGFRRKHWCLRGRFIRRACAGALKAMHDGPLRQRVSRLQRTLGQRDALLARMLKRLTAMWVHPRAGALILIAAHDACVSLALPAAAGADTS